MSSPTALKLADHRFGDGIYFFGVEQQIVLLEQARDAGAVQCQLERAEAERAEKYLAVLQQAAISLPYALHSRRRRGVGVRDQLEGGAVPPLVLVQQGNTGGARGQHN